MKDEDVYYIKNENGCYLQVNDDRVVCLKLEFSEDKTKLTTFKFIKLYGKIPERRSALLDNEPIDILIKYIDLSDDILVREGIPQIKKDVDNEELRYNLRSIL